MTSTQKNFIDRLNSLESLLEAGLRECQKTRRMIQGRVSTRSTGQAGNMSQEDLAAASKAAIARRKQFINSKIKK